MQYITTMWNHIRPYVFTAPTRFGGFCGACYGITKASEPANKQEFPHNLFTVVTYGNLYMMGGFCAGALWPALLPLYGGLYFWNSAQTNITDTPSTKLSKIN